MARLLIEPENGVEIPSRINSAFEQFALGEIKDKILDGLRRDGQDASDFGAHLTLIDQAIDGMRNSPIYRAMAL